MARRAGWSGARRDGAIGDLLNDLERRSQADLLEKRTVIKNGKRRLRFDTGKAIKLGRRRSGAGDRGPRCASPRRRAHPDFFEVLDVAQRVAGLGALGRPRYVALIQGNGGKDGQSLIDLKSQPGSVLGAALGKDAVQAAPLSPMKRGAWWRLNTSCPRRHPPSSPISRSARPLSRSANCSPTRTSWKSAHLAGDVERGGKKRSAPWATSSPGGNCVPAAGGVGPPSTTLWRGPAPKAGAKLAAHPLLRLGRSGREGVPRVDLARILFSSKLREIRRRRKIASNA